MELGISTFGEIAAEHISGHATGAQRRVAELIQEAILADETGLDVYALGEHHRPDYVVSAPEVVLAAVAAVTRHIRLSSAVTVLSSADPVRVFQNFATLDLISKGRAEIMAGRGSFIESFPLFGYDLDDYDELFTEKLELLLQLNDNEVVTSQGKHRPSIPGLGVYPRPYQQRLPVWIAVGGTPASVVRAGGLGLPLTIAILGGDPVHFTQLTKLYRQAAERAGRDSSQLQLAINQHMYIAESSQQAAEEFWPVYSRLMNKVGRERGWQSLTREQFEYMRSPKGSLMVGTAKEVADKIVAEYQLFGNTRFLAQTIAGDIPHSKLMNSIRLFGTEVAPMVRAAIG
ncbi:LLM class flavin-dependent oxidoreductase [Nemorincola caseinilytica]|uniref:LLM class flavin-dependent oxidoreductase n=1 Tax=Nemorincola caseinilytica TaxID=2054315 RepID=A0ABP8NNL8_9BACT